MTYLSLALESPCHFIQWREKDLQPAENHPLIAAAVGLARDAGKIFIVNSDVEGALALGAHGVHLTSSQPVDLALQLVDRSKHPSFLVGKSVHSLEEAEAACSAGADYLLLGPVFAPLSKHVATVSLGLELMRVAVRRVRIPIFALGGMEKSVFAEVSSTGVYGIAGISLLSEWIRRRLEKGE